MSTSSSLGFHNLPFLAHRKSVKKGFEFTVMVVGELMLNLLYIVISMCVCVGMFLVIISL